MEYEEHEGKLFALEGAVDDRRNIPPVAAALLDAENGRGAAQFLIKRVATGTNGDGA